MIFRPAPLWAISLGLFSALVAAQGMSRMFSSLGDSHVQQLTKKWTATAKICNIPYNSDPSIDSVGNVDALLVSNQTDLDAAFAGCTTINGDILISNTYVGGFNLSEVIVMNGTIHTVSIPDPNTDANRALTFIAIDNVQIFNQFFQIASVPNLTSISMANVAVIFYINVTVEGGASLNFPELVDLTGLEIYGTFGR